METPVLEPELDLVPDLAECAPGHEHASGIGQRLDPCGHVHAIAVDVSFLDDDVAHVDPDPELDARVGWDFLFAVGHRPLDLGGAFDRIDGTGELGEQAVSRALHYPAVMTLDRGVDQLGPMGLLAGEGTGFVGSHEAGVPDHVQREYGSEPAFHSFPPTRG